MCYQRYCAVADLISPTAEREILVTTTCMVLDYSLLVLKVNCFSGEIECLCFI